MRFPGRINAGQRKGKREKGTKITCEDIEENTERENLSRLYSKRETKYN